MVCLYSFNSGWPMTSSSTRSIVTRVTTLNLGRLVRLGLAFNDGFAKAPWVAVRHQAGRF